MKLRISRTAEHVSEGHPDKFCDQVADHFLDEVFRLSDNNEDFRKTSRTAIECLAKDNLLIVSGEVKLPVEIKSQLNVSDLARQVWKRIGYGTDEEELTVIDHIRSQSPDIATGKKGSGSGVDDGGAGDQGIMIGYATDETPELMPLEWVYARNICLKLTELRKNGTLGWLRPDCKSQVTIDADGRVTSVIVAAQHSNQIKIEEVRQQIAEQVGSEVIPDFRIDPKKINGTGEFIIGGPTGDAGVVGRKIVVDAYGPRVPVGGGAYSGKDPTKVDRSAAYMARYIAKTVVTEKVAEAKECLVKIAYGIGQYQPEMVSAVTDTGQDVAQWVKERFPDLSPKYIIELLKLRYPTRNSAPEGSVGVPSWTYLETAAYGHYGRHIFPWEQVG